MYNKIIIALFIFVIIPISHSFANEESVKVVVDGKEILFQVQPILKNGVTFVQFRPIFEALGMEIKWNGTDQSITGSKPNVQVKFQIGKDVAYVNGKPVALTQVLELVDGHTIIPLRMIAETSGGIVQWSQSKKTVYVFNSHSGIFNDPRTTVSIENEKGGTPGWQITKYANDGQIQGYASLTSVNRRENISFFVSTRQAGTKYNLNIYRLGWYHGSGARSLQSVNDLTGIAQGWWSSSSGRHNLSEPQATTKILDLSWSSSYELAVPLDWCTGYYLVKLTDQAGFQSYIPFVVRDDNTPHDLLVQASVTTWQGYNDWGGFSFYGHYDNITHKKESSKDYVNNQEVYQKNNASALSFNRPYADEHGAGLTFLEYPTIYWLESKGYDVSYITSLDNHLQRMSWRPKGFISVAHDEYWSREMRDNVTRLRDSGVNLAFLGANDMYWQIRLEQRSGEKEPRTQICYKHDWDPIADPKRKTIQWRNLGEPENEIVGAMYESTVKQAKDWVISDASNELFAHTGAKNGGVINSLIGWEYDKVFNNGHSPKHLQVLATSKFKDGGNNDVESNTTVYLHRSGAAVFDAGTIYWGYGLSNPLKDRLGTVDPRIQGVTQNLINQFISGGLK